MVNPVLSCILACFLDIPWTTTISSRSISSSMTLKLNNKYKIKNKKRKFIKKNKRKKNTLHLHKKYILNSYLKLDDLPWCPFWYACGGCNLASSKDSMDAWWDPTSCNSSTYILELIIFCFFLKVRGCSASLSLKCIYCPIFTKWSK